MKTPNLKSALVFAVLLAGCSSSNSDGVYDPFEPVNREIFEFNHALDKNAALPAATYYKNALPEGLRGGVHNFLSNLALPVTFANDVLQGEITQAGYAACRLGVNSTVGVLGVMDPAAGWGCVTFDEDFGQTLAVYGVPGGPYLVIPLLGSSLPRDALGKIFVDHYFNPLGYVRYSGKYYVSLGQNVIKLVDARSRAVSALHEVERTSIDYYAAMRRLYVLRRNAAIKNDMLVPQAPPDESDLPASSAPAPAEKPPANAPAPTDKAPDAGSAPTPAAAPPASVPAPADKTVTPAPLAPDATTK